MKGALPALLGLLLLAAPAAVQAQFNYTTNADGLTITITGYTGPSGAIIIFSTINGLSVTSIGDSAFSGASLASVTIPDSVTSIGDYAFYDCTGLTSVTIPDSVTNLGGAAFANCGLTNVSIPASVISIGNSAFSACSDLTSVTIANGVTSIEDHAFAYCTGLTSVTIPGSVTNMGEDAFSGTGLTSVTIANGVTSIGGFSGCSGLASVAIPASVTSIEASAFSGCTGLASVTIPGGVTSIGDSAFSGCTGLTRVTIPGSVTNIADYAFFGCTKLTAVYFTGNAPTADLTVFFSDNNLTVYYLFGSTGWGSTFAGVPAVLFQAGLLQVTITPSGAINAGAQWQVDDGTLQNSGATVANLPVGNNTLSFNTITGWTTPANQTVSVSANSTASASGTYVQQFGSLKVTISTAAAITGGAGWQVDGGPLQKSGATVTNLSVGNHTVSFNTISGWITPANQTVAVRNSLTATTSGTYVAIGSVQVTIGPAAITAGARWQVDDGTLQNSGATVTNLSVGNHTISFNTLSGWTTPANQTVSIKAKSVARIKGIYTFTAEGIYNGLFMQADVTEETAGMLSGLDVTASGTYTGKLLIGGSTNAISGGFNVSGQASNYVQRTVKQGGPLMLEMTLNWNDSPPDITGTVSGADGGAWVANLTNKLAANGSSSAEYTAWVLPDGAPPGYGYILITNHAGAVTLSGTLADGTSFSQAVPLSGGDNNLPVYGNLYSRTGLLLGWLSLGSGSPTGNLTWIKPASRSTAIYTNGFTNLVIVQGSPWTNLLPHTAAIDLLSGQLDVSGGSLSSPLSFNVAVSNNNALVKLPLSPTNSLSGSINPKTGLLTVTFGNGIGKATTTGTGAVLQNATNAAGFFLGKTNAGSILLH